MKMQDPINAAQSMSWAVKLGTPVVGYALSIIAPVQPFLIMVFVLLSADVITGIWAARHKGQKFTSKELGRSVPKVVLYPLAILLSQMMVNTYFEDIPVVQSLTYSVALFICTVEFQSNMENIAAITGADVWKRVGEWFLNRKSKQ